MSSTHSMTAAARSIVSPDRPPGTWRGQEIWGWLAYLVAAGFVVLLLYLGIRPGGLGPLYAYGIGRHLLEVFALLTLFVGAVWSVLHRPVLQRRRFAPFVCLALIIGVLAYPIPYPSSHEGHPSAICFRLPVDGPWTVVWGGETSEENRMAGFFPDRRWGLDLVVTENGVSHRGEGLSPSDYFAYGREVHAPADGTVVRVRADIPDTQPGFYDSRVEQFGNHVVIQVAEDEFVFLCHLLQASIPVEPGQRVRTGDVIGRVGSSGFSPLTPQPHLALHLQDTADARLGEAVPWSFCDYTADGRPVDRGLPRGGVGVDGSLLGEVVQASRPPGR